MSQFIKEYRLKQITPMLHFQYKQSGATLRASEVKPKLDKFLVECYRKEKEKKLPVDWCIKSDEADKDDNRIPLNYKMSIFCNEDSRYKINKDENTVIKTPMFFGDNKNVQMVIYKDFITLRITCMNSELRNFINDKIFDFFVLHNFGTRQSKGYGSFLVTDMNNGALDIQKVEKCLKSYYDGSKWISFTYKDNCIKKMNVIKGPFTGGVLVDVENVYSLIKSGINLTRGIKGNHNYVKGYIMTYQGTSSNNGNIGNDKAYLKKSCGDPAKYFNDRRERGVPSKDKCETYEYRRAVLGLHSIYKLNGVIEKNNKRNNIFVHIHSGDNDKIERFMSPILIKIIECQNANKVFVLPPRDEEYIKNILGKPFYFTFDIKKDQNWEEIDKTKSINVPKEFDFNRFFVHIVEKYNKEKDEWASSNKQEIYKRFKDIKLEIFPTQEGGAV